MERYDIYWADIPYYDEDGSKIRPAVIVADIGTKIKVLKITSVGKAPNLQLRISAWHEAGLSKESFIVFEPFYDIDKSRIKEKIGRLQLIDIMHLENYFINGKR